MKYMKLNNGLEMPILGFGVFQITDPHVCEQSVLDALEIGYRLIDTAAVYGNEAAVGRAIRASGVPRDEIFVTSKLWIQDASFDKVEAAYEKSLMLLGLDQLDLYLIHQPYGDVYGAWRGMEKLYAQKRVKAIGVSNFYPDRLIDFVMHNDVKPVLNQIECHPFNQLFETQKLHEELDVQMQSWGPFAEGRLGIFQNPVLAAIGEKYSKSIAQVILRWLVERNLIAIPKSVNKSRIAENFAIFDFELTQEDHAQIATLDTDQSAFGSHRDPELVKTLCEIRI